MTKKRNLLFSFVLLVLLSVPLLFDATALQVLRLKTFDVFVNEQSPSGNFVVLNITEEDVAREGGWPFPRTRLAEIQEELIAKGVLGVGWVILFPQADRLGGDAAFAEALAKIPSVIAMPEYDNGIFPETHGTVVLGPELVNSIEAKGFLENIPVLRDAAEQGAITANVDVDNLLRRMPLLLITPDGWVASFATQVLKVLTGTDTYQIKTNVNGIEAVRVRQLPPINTDNLGRKWVSWVKTEETDLAEMEVQDKFVFIGVTAKGVMPQIATPAGLLEPHKIQAALAESLLIQNSPMIPDYRLALEVLLLLLLGLLVAILSNYLGITWGITLIGAVWAGTAYFGIWTIQQGMLIDVTYSLVSSFFIASTNFYLNFRTQYKLRQQIKKQFEHYLDPRQVKKLQENPNLLKLEGERKMATFLFTDVRGFTSMSEKLNPEQVTEIINIVLTQQVLAVQKYGGMVDKFIGDAMMAIFNAPIDLFDHPNSAISAGIEIIKNMRIANEELKDRGINQQIKIGIGINTGEAVIGNMGSDTRFDYSAIGDAVNLAARLESATKEVGVNILVGHATIERSYYSFMELEPIKVKGKQDEIKIYTLENEGGYYGYRFK